MARRPLISGNWKMHLNHFEALTLVEKLHYLVPKETFESVDVSVHPPFTDLRTVQTTLESNDMAMLLGAQHCHHEPNGAFTGEISPGMLAKLNVRYVIVGHSERRELFGETDAGVNAKAKAIFANSMVPIVCVGESLAQREAGETESVVLAQVAAGLDGLSSEQVAAMVIAYEPIWAIGTGRTATAADAQTVCAAIRGKVADVAGAAAADAVRVQYGGSVKPGNVVELMGQPDIDGALVGGASLSPDDFAQIVRFRD